MSKKSTFLNDPDCEPTDEDWAEITQAAGDKVRAQTERMAKAREERAKLSERSDSEEQ